MRAHRAYTRRMVFRVRVVALALVVVVLAACLCACGEHAADDQATPASPPSPQSSAQATAEARAALRAFFKAWQAKDLAGMDAYLPADRQQGQWLTGLDRVKFGKITESPDLVAAYLTNGRGSASGVKATDVRSFQADVTLFYTPGYQGPADEGQPLAWHWFLERDTDGRWLVTDQGF
jgi:Domain of unknown function (DUF4829)